MGHNANDRKVTSKSASPGLGNTDLGVIALANSLKVQSKSIEAEYEPT